MKAPSITTVRARVVGRGRLKADVVGLWGIEISKVILGMIGESPFQAATME